MSRRDVRHLSNKIELDGTKQTNKPKKKKRKKEKQFNNSTTISLSRNYDLVSQEGKEGSVQLLMNESLANQAS